MIHAPLIVMLVLLAFAIVLSARRGMPGRRNAGVLFAGYPVFALITLL